MGGRSASISAKFGVAVLKASARRSAKFGVAVFKASMLDCGVYLPSFCSSIESIYV